VVLFVNHIVLFHPEIPQNTGNIMRTAMAIEAKLHIIGPLPFTLNDQTIKRTGLDYIEHLKYHYYDDYEQFIQKEQPKKLQLISRYGDRLYTDMAVSKVTEEHYFMFGSESKGLSESILATHRDSIYRIPMSVIARSLNLANAVALVMYEVLRQQNFHGLATQEVLKGDHFLDKKLNQ
jgi:tRNA (cytidine/uridine-2'-O-)-methyltransferase